MNIDDTAETIYRHFYGHLDDKRYRTEKVGEIADWLHEGDMQDAPTVRALIDEWGEYDETEINAQDPDYVTLERGE